MVALLDVIEHVSRPQEMLAPIVLAARVPARCSWITAPALPASWSSWDVELGHYRRYTRRTLRDEITDLALELVEACYLFPELLAPALVRRPAHRSCSWPDDG